MTGHAVDAGWNAVLFSKPSDGKPCESSVADLCLLPTNPEKDHANERVLTFRKLPENPAAVEPIREKTIRRSRRSWAPVAASAYGRPDVPPLLEVTGLRKNFGPVRALSGAELSLQAGEVLALVGDNGAGKSTLIKHISGVYKADAGEIRLNGAVLNLHGPADARRLGIETVYQDLALADDLSVGANVFLGREPVRRWLGLLAVIDNRKIRDETDALLSRVESRISLGT